MAPATAAVVLPVTAADESRHINGDDEYREFIGPIVVAVGLSDQSRVDAVGCRRRRRRRRPIDGLGLYFGGRKTGNCLGRRDTLNTYTTDGTGADRGMGRREDRNGCCKRQRGTFFGDARVNCSFSLVASFGLCGSLILDSWRPIGTQEVPSLSHLDNSTESQRFTS